ncbi:ABC transporter permease [Actinocatenispora rupis]|uniref:Peptide ABC transporter permease n=1 Tax=Actinocatenispora rupis TaxID=519421 RepID=A0A8J3JA87_9ACTN|nr:ABC transporter permease [Actinocatenispora rupis]GID12942.1 peptide ABC transporter permease [Actinocatenispora rupis]
MARYLLKRVLGALVVLLVLSAVVYLIFYALPGNPAQLVCGPKTCQADQLHRIEVGLGLDQPIWLQYWHFLVGIVAGRTYSGGPEVIHCAAPCLGYSYQTGEPVTGLLLDRLPVSLSLIVGGFVIWVTVGVALGVLSALRRGRAVDRIATGLTLAGNSTPVFLVGLLLLIVFCVYLRWLPFPGYQALTVNPLLWAQNLILPWVALSVVSAAVYTRLTRTSMLETLSEDHIRTFRAYGLPERRVIGRHALRGALTPLITIGTIDLATSLTGTTLTESLFGLPGLGQLLVSSVRNIDLPVVVGVTLLAGAVIVVANAAADVLYSVADRRVALA